MPIFDMNKKGNEYFLLGFSLIIIGFILSVGLFYYSCISRGSDELYDLDHMNQCVSSPSNWLIFLIGIVIATVGGIIVAGSTR